MPRLVARRHGARLDRVERGEQVQVPVARERLDDGAPRLRAARPRAGRAARRRPRRPRQRRDLDLHRLERGRPASRAGPSDRAEPARARRGATPPRRGRRSGRATRRNARSRRVATRSLVEVLRVGAEPGAGVVERACAVACSASASASASRGGASFGIATGCGTSARSSARKSFGRSSPGVGARPAELLLEPAERALVALEQLDLELAEAAARRARRRARRRVVDDLGAVRAHGLPGGCGAARRARARGRAGARRAARSSRAAAARAGLAARARCGARPAGASAARRRRRPRRRCRSVTPCRARRRSVVSW